MTTFPVLHKKEECFLTRVVNIGSINIDYVYAVPHFVREGETLSSTSRQIFPGGKGLNQSVALSRAGASVSHAGMVGDDGGYLLESLKTSGVDVSLVEKCSIPTGHTVIQVTPDGQNCILLFPGANRELSESFVDRTLDTFKDGDILVMQDETSAVAYAMKAAKAKGMRIAFNPSPIGAHTEKYPLQLVDWFLLNEIEGQTLTGKSATEDILDGMAERFPNAVTVLTLGQDGVLAYANGKKYAHGSYKVKAVDTTAAGDTFTGYFIASASKGEPIEESLRLASIAASISVSRQGASVSIPTLDEVIMRSGA